MSRDLDDATDILTAARLAHSYIEGISYAEFMANTMRQDAIIRELLIMGEAAKRLSPDFKTQHPSIPWRQMAGMRDILVHAYHHVDVDEVWRVVTAELEPLIALIEPLIPAKD